MYIFAIFQLVLFLVTWVFDLLAIVQQTRCMYKECLYIYMQLD